VYFLFLDYEIRTRENFGGRIRKLGGDKKSIVGIAESMTMVMGLNFAKDSLFLVGKNSSIKLNR